MTKHIKNLIEKANLDLFVSKEKAQEAFLASTPSEVFETMFELLTLIKVIYTLCKNESENYKTVAKSYLEVMLEKSSEILDKSPNSLDVEMFNFHVKAALKVIKSTERGESYVDDQ